MQHLRPVGRGASARKYDVLTALGAHALAAKPTEQRRVLRLMTLITARYNWAADCLAVGQREIAALWACTDRTVKREFAVLKGRGWLVVRRQGARGRVSEFSLDLDRILTDTQEIWHVVGPDFAERVGRVPAHDSHLQNVVPLRSTTKCPIPDAADSSEWGLARHVLRAGDAGLYGAWVHALVREGRAGGHLVLRAPSRFHAAYVQTHLGSRLLEAIREIDPSLQTLEIVS